MALASLGDRIAAVLTIDNPRQKIFETRLLNREWLAGRVLPDCTASLPDWPAQAAGIELRMPRDMPRRRGQTQASRVAMLHALAHIEYVAIDLALDLVGRFGADRGRNFVSDWLAVAAEEALHFALLDRRLRDNGSRYGLLPAHGGLWEAAYATRHDVMARLAVVPMVLEARGLDVTPALIDKFEAMGDEASASVMRRILNDEIKHVSVGTRWFRAACESSGLEPPRTWQRLVATYFKGRLKPPFNDSARESAGLTCEFYQELASHAPSAQ